MSTFEISSAPAKPPFKRLPIPSVAHGIHGSVNEHDEMVSDLGACSGHQPVR
jgi:hypothetical protein